MGNLIGLRLCSKLRCICDLTPINQFSSYCYKSSSICLEKTDQPSIYMYIKPKFVEFQKMKQLKWLSRHQNMALVILLCTCLESGSYLARYLVADWDNEIVRQLHHPQHFTMAYIQRQFGHDCYSTCGSIAQALTHYNAKIQHTHTLLNIII